MTRRESLLLLHFIVLLWGFTGPLGRFITLSALPLVWWRLVFALAGITLWITVRRVPPRATGRELMLYGAVGALITAHWVCFFHAIKVSNVSITLACLALGPLCVALLEPLFFARRVVWYELVLGLVGFAGIYVIFRAETRFALGIGYALLATLFSAFHAVLVGKITHGRDARVLTLYELGSGGVLLTVWMAVTGELQPSLFTVSYRDLAALVLLAWLCTSFTFVAGTEILKTLSPFTVMNAVNLEPVYGIIMARLMFGESEKMTPAFYLGAVLVLATVVGDVVLKKILPPAKVPEPIVVSQGW